jgi:type IV pilus assembly protein PilW
MFSMKVATIRQRGFSLIELMVGVVIGLLTVLVITQVMTLAEGKRRTVSMGSDAQINGALALFALQRDIAQAGSGAVAAQSLGCTVNYQFGSSAASSFTLAPVVITDGASGAPDTISILQANTTSFSAPMLLTGVHLKTDNHFTVASSLGALAGNLMIAVPQTQDAADQCALFSVTNDGASPATTSTLTNTNVPHVAGSGAAQWNQSAVLPATGYTNGSYLLNMGAMVYRKYSVGSTGNLQVNELSLADGTGMTGAGTELYPQIVNLQAMYGKDTDGNGSVDTYDTVTPTTNAGWMQVLSVRLAVVARSNQYEKDIVTSTAPLWDVGSGIAVAGATACNGGSQCLALNVNTLADWQHYRYKVYDTIVPLRNVLWHF